MEESVAAQLDRVSNLYNACERVITETRNLENSKVNIQLLNDTWKKYEEAYKFVAGCLLGAEKEAPHEEQTCNYKKGCLSTGFISKVPQIYIHRKSIHFRY